MLKWLGAGLVICGSAAIGASMTGDLRRRILELQEMRQPFQGFLECMADQMEEYRGEAMAEIFRQGMKERLGATALRATDLELLERFGESLGYLDVKTQMDSMDLFLEQVSRLCLEAEEELRSKAKVYRYLGVSAGLFLAIILI